MLDHRPEVVKGGQGPTTPAPSAQFSPRKSFAASGDATLNHMVSAPCRRDSDAPIGAASCVRRLSELMCKATGPPMATPAPYLAC